jgi:5-methylcytosine-specific restriction endonuclease McrA
MRKTGTFDARPVRGRYITRAGYIKLLKPDHFLSDSGGHVFEHRFVMFEKLNGECSECFWCGCSLQWDCAVVDHLDENKRNNNAANLVLSCNNCNRARGAMIPFIERMRPEAVDVLFERIRAHRSSRRG